MSLCMDTLNLPDGIQTPPLPFVTLAFNLSEPICLMPEKSDPGCHSGTEDVTVSECGMLCLGPGDLCYSHILDWTLGIV